MKNKFKKLTSLLLASIMMLVALPIQTLAAEWGKGDTVYAAMIGDFVGSDGKPYADKYNYDYIYYKSDGSIGKATRYASTHAKLGISKNGIIQPAICIEAGVAYNTGSSYVGEGNNNTYFKNLSFDIRRDLKIALLCGFNNIWKVYKANCRTHDSFILYTDFAINLKISSERLYPGWKSV